MSDANDYAADIEAGRYGHAVVATTPRTGTAPVTDVSRIERLERIVAALVARVEQLESLMTDVVA